MLKRFLMDSWSFFVNHAMALSMIILPIVVPIDVFTTLYQYFLASEEFVFSEQVILMAIGFIAYPLYAVGVVFYIASNISGEALATKALWKLGAKFWLPFLVMSILIGFSLMFGLVLLIVPGIILLIRYAFSEFDLLLNKSKPLDAMKNSWDATKEHMWIIFGGYAVITLFLYVPYYFANLIFDESGISYLVLETVLNIVYSVLGVLYTIFAFRVYEFAKLQQGEQGR